ASRIAFTVTRYTPSASTDRPAMWRAFTRASEAAAAARTVRATHVSHGAVRVVRHRGRVRVHAATANHATNTASSAASTLIRFCPGRLTSGRVPSNGATRIQRHTPAQAVLDTSARESVSATVRPAGMVTAG